MRLRTLAALAVLSVAAPAAAEDEPGDATEQTNPEPEDAPPPDGSEPGPAEEESAPAKEPGPAEEESAPAKEPGPAEEESAPAKEPEAESPDEEEPGPAEEERASADEPPDEEPAPGEDEPPSGVETTDADCRATAECEILGLCTATENGCKAVRDADCQQADVCQLEGECLAENEACVEPDLKWHGDEPPPFHGTASREAWELEHGLNRTTKGLVIAGSITTGTSWVITTALAAILDSDTPGLTTAAIPGIGPWVALGVVQDHTALSLGLLTVSGLVQASGIAMLVPGIVIADYEVQIDEDAKAAFSIAPGHVGAHGTF